MSQVIGNCGKHPGFNMVNCPQCEIEKQQTMAKKFWNNVLSKNPLVLTNWDAILEVRKEYKKSLLVKDPKCNDAAQYISWDDVKAIFRYKPFFPNPSL